MEILNSFINYVIPHCLICNERGLPHKHCNLCNDSMIFNMSSELRDNHRQYLINEPDVLQADLICSTCNNKRTYAMCEITRKPFHLIKNLGDQWNHSKKLKKLSPYHKYSKMFHSLSPEGLKILNESYSTYLSDFGKFIKGTKGEYIKGYQIKKSIRRIEVTEKCNNPGEVEDYLRNYCAQVGANGYIKFFWDKKIEYHEEEVSDHYTRRWTSTYFVGHADAVILVPDKQS